MIFSELYSVYFQTMAQILKAAVERPLLKGELYSIIEKNAFGESGLTITPAIAEERWQLIHADETTPLRHVPTLPLTILEKRWLKAIFADPRIKLFTDEETPWPEVEPLFQQEDILIFDQYSDGDPYTDADYIRNFRLVLAAVRNRVPLRIETTNHKGRLIQLVLMPEYIEYSEKDDKFRLIGSGSRYGGIINLGRIVNVKPYDKPYDKSSAWKQRPKSRTVELELVDDRNALERVLLHFAHFEKQAERLNDSRYKVRVTYDVEDETEMVIRILSFGPMVKVTAPSHFVELIKERLRNQKSCEH